MTNLFTVIVMLIASMVSVQNSSFEEGRENALPTCENVNFKEAIELFATFKPESTLHPNGGLDRTEAELTNVKNHL
ncbi:hypothetical protein [Flavobacterium luminosum]|uniref:Uncharacterized protein n=1 Tax=Flavobacterium luminosum TaxID=2949086 RepID=A0ABT0TLW6_9FLAO|nr:hypothetical protein [Flavobacterium sp. HXWNR70]MCL9808462.1 hypothetical protein [Flavobacterium sp. HXWNR70]